MSAEEQWTREAVLERLRSDFPSADQTELLGILDRIEADPMDPDGRGRARVQLDVIALSGGDVDALRNYVEAARTDFRDVITWAEYPKSDAENRAAWDSAPSSGGKSHRCFVAC